MPVLDSKLVIDFREDVMKIPGKVAAYFDVAPIVLNCIFASLT